MRRRPPGSADRRGVHRTRRSDLTAVRPRPSASADPATQRRRRQDHRWTWVRPNYSERRFLARRSGRSSTWLIPNRQTGRPAGSSPRRRSRSSTRPGNVGTAVTTSGSCRRSPASCRVSCRVSGRSRWNFPYATALRAALPTITQHLDQYATPPVCPVPPEICLNHEELGDQRSLGGQERHAPGIHRDPVPRTSARRPYPPRSRRMKLSVQGVGDDRGDLGMGEVGLMECS